MRRATTSAVLTCDDPFRGTIMAGRQWGLFQDWLASTDMGPGHQPNTDTTKWCAATFERKMRCAIEHGIIACMSSKLSRCSDRSGNLGEWMNTALFGIRVAATPGTLQPPTITHGRFDYLTDADRMQRHVLASSGFVLPSRCLSPMGPGDHVWRRTPLR